MDEEDCTMDEEEDHAIDTIVIYILECFQMERPRSTLNERLPKAICGDKGANYVHRLLYGNCPDLCHKVLHLDKDVFIHLVSMFMKRGLLKKGCFVKVAEILFWQEGQTIGRLKIAFNILHQQ